MKLLSIFHDFYQQMCLWAAGMKSFHFLLATFVSLMIPFADPKCPSRYHCTHEAGVHSVGLTWIHKLHKFLGSGEYSELFSIFHRLSQKVVWNRKIIVKINETRSCFFDKITKIDKLLARLTKK